MISDEEASLFRLAAEGTPGALDVYIDWLLIHDPVRGEFLRKSSRPEYIPWRDATREVRWQEESAWRSALGLGQEVTSLSLGPLPNLISIPAAKIASIEPVLEKLPFIQIDLEFPHASPEGMKRIFDIPAMAKLRNLSFTAYSEEVDQSENYQSMIRTSFGDAVFPALCAASNLAQLEGLWLGYYEIGAQLAPLLVTAPFVALRTLSISQEPVGDDGIALIASSPIVKTLRRLRLESCGLTDAGAAILAHAPNLSGLEELRVRGNHGVTDAGLATLRASPYLRALRDLQ